MAKLAGWFAGTDRTTSNARGQVVRGFAIQAPCPHSTAPLGSWIYMGELIVVTVA